MSRVRTEPENLQVIHQRYEDTSLVIFRQDQKRAREPATYLSFGDSCRKKQYAYTRWAKLMTLPSANGPFSVEMNHKSFLGGGEGHFFYVSIVSSL